jgi:hypothetical protein
MNFCFEDFTEAQYRELVRLMMNTWSPRFFDAYEEEGRICLWRHDVDISMHRAWRLAEIEHAEGLCSTYFVWLHSPFYSVFEREIGTLLKKIERCGHRIGLHFDVAYYRETIDDPEVLEDNIVAERCLLGDLVGCEIESISYHNSSDVAAKLVSKSETIGGMINARSSCIRKSFGYCSDSNGYWRSRRLRTVLEEARDERLHVLTHPVWWTPTAMSPRARVSRCIEGRSACHQSQYDAQME